jgi:hypothetical protein
LDRRGHLGSSLHSLFHHLIIQLGCFNTSLFNLHKMRGLFSALAHGLLLSSVLGQNTTEQEFNKRRTISVGIVCAPWLENRSQSEISDLPT